MQSSNILQVFLYVMCATRNGNSVKAKGHHMGGFTFPSQGDVMGLDVLIFQDLPSFSYVYYIYKVCLVLKC